MYKTLKGEPGHDLFVGVQSMFNMVPGTCASDTTTALLNQAVAGLSDSFFRSSFNCTQEVPVWSGNTGALDRAIFCGYKQVRGGHPVSPPPPLPPLDPPSSPLLQLTPLRFNAPSTGSHQLEVQIHVEQALEF